MGKKSVDTRWTVPLSSGREKTTEKMRKMRVDIRKTKKLTAIFERFTKTREILCVGGQAR
jgi:hypothetical protein